MYMKDVRQGIHSAKISLVQSIVYTQGTSPKISVQVQQEPDVHSRVHDPTQPLISPEKKEKEWHSKQYQ